MPSTQQGHFVPVYDHEAEWKAVVSYSAPDDSYIVIAAPDGHVLWQRHGSFSDGAYQELKEQIFKLTANLQK